MKKFKLVAAGLFVCAATVVGYQAYDNAASQQQLLLQNVEALAKAEASGKKECYDTITGAKAQQVRYCSTCEYIEGKPTTFSSLSEC